MSNVMCDNCWDLGLCSKCQEALEAQQNKIKDIVVCGLLTDGTHHKQYALERVLEAIGVNMKVLKSELRKEGYEWEWGIPP